MSPTQSSAATVKDEENIAGALEGILLEITGSKIEPGQSLVRSGILDSLKVVELIAKVEDRFGIELSGNDLEIGNFETLDALSALITRKREAH